MSKIKVTEIPIPSPLLRGEGKGEGRFGYLNIGSLEFGWGLEIVYWNLMDGVYYGRS